MGVHHLIFPTSSDARDQDGVDHETQWSGQLGEVMNRHAGRDGGPEFPVSAARDADCVASGEECGGEVEHDPRYPAILHIVGHEQNAESARLVGGNGGNHRAFLSRTRRDIATMRCDMSRSTASVTVPSRSPDTTPVISL